MAIWLTQDFKICSSGIYDTDKGLGECQTTSTHIYVSIIKNRKGGGN